MVFLFLEKFRYNPQIFMSEVSFSKF